MHDIALLSVKFGKKLKNFFRVFINAILLR